MDKDKLNISLALSGGGFRATLFHLGVIRRLVELGLFRNIETVSSASGGSFLNGLLGLYYDEVNDIDDFDELISKKIRAFVRINVRNRLLFFTLPYFLSKWKFCGLMDKFLYNDRKLTDLSKNVKNIFNATDLNSGMRWRFNSSNFGGFDYGYCENTKDIKISEAVYSSSAFPGLLAPFTIKKHKYWFQKKDNKKKFLNPEKIQLLDGGIYDNTSITGLHYQLENEASFVIASDAIETFDKRKRSFNLFNQIKRMGLIILDRKTRMERTSLIEDFTRRRNKDGSFKNSKLNGIIFLMKKDCMHYRNIEDDQYYIPPTKDDIPIDIGWDEDVVYQLSHMRTDLDKLHDIEIEYLMYHGASLLDVALRKWHPDVYGDQHIPLPKPDYDDKKAKRILSRCHKTCLFNFLRYL